MCIFDLSVVKILQTVLSFTVNACIKVLLHYWKVSFCIIPWTVVYLNLKFICSHISNSNIQMCWNIPKFGCCIVYPMSPSQQMCTFTNYSMVTICLILYSNVCVLFCGSKSPLLQFYRVFLPFLVYINK